MYITWRGGACQRDHMAGRPGWIWWSEAKFPPKRWFSSKMCHSNVAMAWSLQYLVWCIGQDANGALISCQCVCKKKKFSEYEPEISCTDKLLIFGDLPVILIAKYQSYVLCHFVDSTYYWDLSVFGFWATKPAVRKCSFAEWKTKLKFLLFLFPLTANYREQQHTKMLQPA